MPSIQTIHYVAHQARRPDWQSHLNCGAINTHIRDELNDTLGLIADLAIGELAQKPAHQFGSEHAWVYIPKEHVDEDTPVIIDGALDQFCIENHDDGYVYVTFGPREDFPPRVTVIARNDQHNTDFTTGLFDHYIEQEREGPNQYHAHI